MFYSETGCGFPLMVLVCFICLIDPALTSNAISTGLVEMTYSEDVHPPSADSAVLSRTARDVEPGGIISWLEYSANDYRTWYIEASSYSIITLEFSKFSLERNFDYLKIYTVSNSNYETLSRSLTGDVTSGVRYSFFAYKLVLRATSDSYTRNGDGFILAYYGGEEIGSSNDPCTSTVCFISWLGYPAETDRRWYIQTEAVSGIVKLEFPKFELESGYDYLRIYVNDSETLIGKLSGDLSGNVYNIPATRLVLRATSDYTGNEAGFLLVYYGGTETGPPSPADSAYFNLSWIGAIVGGLCMLFVIGVIVARVVMKKGSHRRRTHPTRPQVQGMALTVQQPNVQQQLIQQLSAQQHNIQQHNVPHHNGQQHNVLQHNVQQHTSQQLDPAYSTPGNALLQSQPVQRVPGVPAHNNFTPNMAIGPGTAATGGGTMAGQYPYGGHQQAPHPTVQRPIGFETNGANPGGQLTPIEPFSPPPAYSSIAPPGAPGVNTNNIVYGYPALSGSY